MPLPPAAPFIRDRKPADPKLRTTPTIVDRSPLSPAKSAPGLQKQASGRRRTPGNGMGSGLHKKSMLMQCAPRFGGMQWIHEIQSSGQHRGI